MAQLTPSKLSQLRRRIAVLVPVVEWTKPTINVVLQTIEDWFESAGPDISAAMVTTVTVDEEATAIRDQLDADRATMAATLVLLTEAWLVEHPPQTESTRFDVTKIQTWIADNAYRVPTVPEAAKPAVLRAMVEHRLGVL